MAIEIVDFPIKNGDFPWQNVSSPDLTRGYDICNYDIAGISVSIIFRWWYIFFIYIYITMIYCNTVYRLM